MACGTKHKGANKKRTAAKKKTVAMKLKRSAKR